MKFRIVKYYDRYEAQFLNKKGEYVHIGSPNGYYSVEEAKRCCKRFKEEMEDQVVEEFEL